MANRLWRSAPQVAWLPKHSHEPPESNGTQVAVSKRGESDEAEVRRFKQIPLSRLQGVVGRPPAEICRRQQQNARASNCQVDVRSSLFYGARAGMWAIFAWRSAISRRRRSAGLSRGIWPKCLVNTAGGKKEHHSAGLTCAAPVCSQRSSTRSGQLLMSPDNPWTTASDPGDGSRRNSRAVKITMLPGVSKRRAMLS